MVCNHYNATTALEELQEDALLPHPVKLRDMILRTEHGPEEAQRLNQEFQDYPDAIRRNSKTCARDPGESCCRQE